MSLQITPEKTKNLIHQEQSSSSLPSFNPAVETFFSCGLLKFFYTLIGGQYRLLVFPLLSVSQDILLQHPFPRDRMRGHKQKQFRQK